MTCGCEVLPSMRTLVPACSISTPAIPRSATLSMSSRISFRFNRCPSDQLVAKQDLRPGQLESGPPVIAVRPENEKDEVFLRDGREKCDVPLRDEGEL